MMVNPPWTRLLHALPPPIRLKRAEGQTGVELYELNLYACALAPDHLQMWDSECADGCT